MSDSNPQQGGAQQGMSSGGQSVMNAVNHSTMPRSMRTRVEGQPIDPVPRGMHVEESPGTVARVANEGDVGGAPPGPLDMARMDKSERLDKMHEMQTAHDGARNMSGQGGPKPRGNDRTTPPGQAVYQKTMQSGANKMMDSRQGPKP